MSTRLPPKIVGDGFTSDFAWELLEDLVEISDRSGGHAGEREGARIVEQAFRDIGARDVRIDEFTIPGWWRQSSALTVADTGERYESDHQIIALPGTAATDIEAELVDVGYGIPEEFGSEVDGAIALVRSDTPEDADRWYHRMEKYAAAVDNGAVGFVFRNHVEGCLPPTGEIGDHDRPAPIPAVGVSKETGSRLARSAAGSTVQFEIDCRNEPTSSSNVSASLGPETDTELLITAHIDSHDIAEGAADNGAGSVLVCEIARLLSSVEDELDTRVRFVTFGSEEVGLYGAYDWVESHDSDRIKCVMNIDGAGGSRTPAVRRTHTFETTEPPFERAADRVGTPIEIDDDVSPHSDAWPFAERGVPAVTVGSKSDESGRGWGHTHADTLDKLDPRDIRSLAVVFAEAAVELADDDVEIEPKDPEEIKEELDEHYETELRVAGRWPYS